MITLPPLLIHATVNRKTQNRHDSLGCWSSITRVRGEEASGSFSAEELRQEEAYFNKHKNNDGQNQLGNELNYISQVSGRWAQVVKHHTGDLMACSQFRGFGRSARSYHASLWRLNRAVSSSLSPSPPGSLAICFVSGRGQDKQATGPPPPTHDTPK